MDVTEYRSRTNRSRYVLRRLDRGPPVLETVPGAPERSNGRLCPRKRQRTRPYVRLLAGRVSVSLSTWEARGLACLQVRLQDMVELAGHSGFFLRDMGAWHNQFGLWPRRGVSFGIPPRRRCPSRHRSRG